MFDMNGFMWTCGFFTGIAITWSYFHQLRKEELKSLK